MNSNYTIGAFNPGIFTIESAFSNADVPLAARIAAQNPGLATILDPEPIDIYIDPTNLAGDGSDTDPDQLSDGSDTDPAAAPVHTVSENVGTYDMMQDRPVVASMGYTISTDNSGVITIAIVPVTGTPDTRIPAMTDIMPHPISSHDGDILDDSNLCYGGSDGSKSSATWCEFKNDEVKGTNSNTDNKLAARRRSRTRTRRLEESAQDNTRPCPTIDISAVV